MAGLRSCPGCGQAMAVRIIAKALAHAGAIPTAQPVQCSCGTRSFPMRAGGFLTGKPLRRRRPLPNRIKLLRLPASQARLQQGLALCAEARKKKQPLLYICLFNESGIERHGAPDGPGSLPGPDRPASCSALRHMQACLEKAQAAKPDYFATACPAYPFDLVEKISRGAALRGHRLSSACCAPARPGCLYDPALSLESGKSAVETGLFPLYEMGQGRLQPTVAAGPVPASALCAAAAAAARPGAAGARSSFSLLADNNLRSLHGNMIRTEEFPWKLEEKKSIDASIKKHKAVGRAR